MMLKNRVGFLSGRLDKHAVETDFTAQKLSVLGKNVCSRYSTVTNLEMPDSLSMVGAHFLEYPRGEC